MNFVHLRTHTEYSVVDGTLRISDMVKAAAADAQGALAITDLSNLFGAVKFYSKARKAGIKPILGADVWLEWGDARIDKTPHRLLLLACSRQGYLNLCELLSKGWLENPHPQRAQAQIKKAWLLKHAEGLIVLSGAEGGAMGQALLKGNEATARKLAQTLAKAFPDRFYIELQRAGLPGQDKYVRAAVAMAAELALPVVATHPIQFATPQDFEAHEARVCVADGDTLGNASRVKRFSREQHFKTQAQMQELFADVPSSLANSVVIAKRCNLSLLLGKPQLPDFATPLVNGQPQPMADFFREQSLIGLQARLIQLYPNEQDRERERPKYEERLEFEIKTILKMGFPGYFLIVADFINWAKNNGCPVGPGRGSGAGSLVAYSLKITDLDPLRYKLLFERFLNPDRVSMPDFDIDFCQANRDRVIDYVKERYGRDAVSQIVTFGTMAAKAALRDVGRVLGMAYGHVDSIAKLVPAPPGKTVTLRRPPEKPDTSVIYARREAPELEQREQAEEEVAELLALAERVEGIVRNVGMHAGGVLIAPGRITDFCPLYMQPGSDSAVSQFDKDDVESIGLVKFDFLGLATLTILQLTQDWIRARDPAQVNFTFEHLPLDDKGAYRLMSEGKTVAVFQLESPGMQRMLRDAKPSVFEDVIALVALYRPGPMDLIPTFCARKHGREDVSYPHPLMQDVLQETYGIMVYQEQVMQVAQLLGGYSLGGADLLRRAMGKKKLEEMVKHRATFAEGAAQKGIKEPLANEIFDLMEKFAGYGFNKSHAAAYALLAYHTAWAKVHYPAEFVCANMTVAMDDTDKLKVFHDDAHASGIQFEAPDVNQGEYQFIPIDPKRVRYGLGAIKGTGRSAIEAIVASREQNGPFTSLFDLCARVDRARMNKRTVEALIKAGALDSINPDRAGLIANVPVAFEFAESQAAHAQQLGLFDFGHEDNHGASTQEPELQTAQAWSIREQLMHEKSALGFYISGHLFDQNEAEIRQFVKIKNADVMENREPQLLAGIVSHWRVINGQRGRVGIFKLDDKTEALEAVMNEELLHQHKDWLKDDELVILQVKAQPDRFAGGLRLNVLQVWNLPQARCRFAKFLRLESHQNGVHEKTLSRSHAVSSTSEKSLAQNDSFESADNLPSTLQHLLDAFPARQSQTDSGILIQGLRLRLVIQRAQAQAELDLGDEARFYPSEEALAQWQRLWLGGARVVYE